MKKLTTTLLFLIFGCAVMHSQSFTLRTFTTAFQPNFNSKSAVGMRHFQTEDYTYKADVLQKINTPNSAEVSLMALVSKPIQYGFSLSFSPDWFKKGNGSGAFVLGHSTVTQREEFLYTEYQNEEEFDILEGKQRITRNYASIGVSWNQQLFSIGNWDLLFSLEQLCNINTTAESVVTIIHTYESGSEFSSFDENIEVSTINSYSTFLRISPRYNISETIKIGLDAGFNALVFNSNKVYSKSLFSPNIGLSLNYQLK